MRQLAESDPQEVGASLGPTIGPWLVQIARGRASSRVTGTPYIARSRSRETTFQTDLVDWEQVSDEVARLARRVAADVAKEQRPAIRVVVKVRYAPFFTHTHGRALPAPTMDAADIEKAALAVLAKFEDERPVRLLGVRAEFTR